MDIICQQVINSFVNLNRSKRYSYILDFPKKSLNRFDDIKFAAINLYESGVPFRIGQSYKKYNGSVIKYKRCLNKISQMVFDYFNKPGNTPNDQTNFNVLHKKLCDEFLKLNNNPLPSNYYSYGNAQKMINMLFKYLTCFIDYNNYADLFSYCHMPIDRTILNELNNIPGVSIKGIKNSTYNSTPWTKLTPKEYNDLFNEYKKALIKLKNGSCWLAIEYRLWTKNGLPGPCKKATIIGKFYM